MTDQPPEIAVMTAKILNAITDAGRPTGTGVSLDIPACLESLTNSMAVLIAIGPPVVDRAALCAMVAKTLDERIVQAAEKHARGELMPVIKPRLQ